MESGIYIVTLNNEVPISVNAHDPRRASTSIKVNKMNCKVGKTIRLKGREKDYFRPFKEENVNFILIAILADIDIAERAIKAKVKNFRIRGITGRPNEWLENILPEDVIRIVIQTLKNLEKGGHISIYSWGITI